MEAAKRRWERKKIIILKRQRIVSGSKSSTNPPEQKKLRRSDIFGEIHGKIDNPSTDVEGSEIEPTKNNDQIQEAPSDPLAEYMEFNRFLKSEKQDFTASPESVKNSCLIEIEKLLRLNGKTLKDYACMPYVDFSELGVFENILLANELMYDKVDMLAKHKEYYSNLNFSQKAAYDCIVNAVNGESGGFFFVDGYGGTGKTYLWRALSFRFRSESKIVLNVASSGIASLLLPGGRTAHSQFAIPLVLNESSCCNVKQGSVKAELLQQAGLIIWDEAPMINKWALEALDRTLRDIMRFECANSMDRPFGGKTVVLGGDFRQILPVIPKGSRADTVHATINSSRLWQHCVVLKLTENMRLQFASDDVENENIKRFAKWILNIGDGKLGEDNDGEATIEMFQDILIQRSVNPIEDIVEATYPNFLDNLFNAKFFEDRAILAPTLEVVEKVNNFVMSLMPGEEKTYLSCDSVCKVDVDASVNHYWLTTEFLNEIQCSGLPNHKLILKRGVPVILMKNIDLSSGLCNGTRLIVDELGVNVIGARIITGNHVGDKVFIPRMNLVSSDGSIPVKFQRLQFPLSLCFAMTINKSQGQTLSHVGLYFPRSVFAHDQLYVAVSRVKSLNGLKVLIADDYGEWSTSTKNVVYSEVFQKI
ncbi:ATP-dependent DNA helicase PIF1-like isoform X2 [Trifolium pratense]|uniref:ATP-dependent DNA helicase PIF1-like isoform X2 n=1 Tax=Trifolium pratense TaxID=57577 RepID=UPI001E694CEF|nr:ATP-dependent DNA helicase PIF1-like isoform X2 [Trifolium pratense]